jgi:hypothetical protein
LLNILLKNTFVEYMISNGLMYADISGLSGAKKV